MMHHDSGAVRHASSPLGRTSTVARRRQREDAGEEEGDDGEPDNPDAENISGGAEHGDDAVDEEDLSMTTKLKPIQLMKFRAH